MNDERTMTITRDDAYELYDELNAIIDMIYDGNYGETPERLNEKLIRFTRIGESIERAFPEILDHGPTN